MTISFRVNDLERFNHAHVRSAILSTLEMDFQDLTPSGLAIRKDFPFHYKVLGTIDYLNLSYDVLHLDGTIYKNNNHLRSAILELYPVDRIDGIIRFAETGYDSNKENIPSFAYLDFEPDSEKIDFLSTFAERFSRCLPDVSNVWITYLPEHNGPLEARTIF